MYAERGAIANTHTLDVHTAEAGMHDWVLHTIVSKGWLLTMMLTDEQLLMKVQWVIMPRCLGSVPHKWILECSCMMQHSLTKGYPPA